MHVSYNDIRRWKQRGDFPVDADAKMRKRVRRRAEQFVLDGNSGRLYLKGRLVIETQEDKEKVLNEVHGSATGGHVGIRAAIKKARKAYEWHTMVEDITEFIKRCHKCQLVNPPPLKAEQPELHPISVPKGTFQQWGVDLVGPLTVTDAGNKYIIAATDYFSKWMEAKPLQTKDAISVAKFLYEDIYCRYGAVRVLISDQGKELCNKANDKMHEMWGVQHRMTSAYHPQANGLQERGNQTMQRWLMKVCTEQKCKDWDKSLPAVLFASRSIEQRTIGMSPFRAVHLRDAILPLQLQHMNLCDPEEASEEVIEHLKTMQEEIFEKCSGNIKKSQKKMKEDYDSRHQQKSSIKVGDTVLLENTSRNSRVACSFDQMPYRGPYVVESVSKRGSCRLRHTETYKKEVASLKRLKKYNTGEKGQGTLKERQEGIRQEEYDVNSEQFKKGEIGDTDMVDSNYGSTDDSEGEITSVRIHKKARIGSEDEDHCDVEPPPFCLSVPIPWAGGLNYRLSNTCPIDNCLAIIQSAASQPGSCLLGHLLNSDQPTHVMLATVIAAILKGEVGAAKDLWVELLTDMGILAESGGVVKNLWGSEREFFFNVFHENYAITVTTRCSNGPFHCPRYQTDEVIRMLAAQGTAANLQKFLDEVLTSQEKVCGQSIPEERRGEPDMDDRVTLIAVLDEDGNQLVEIGCNGVRSITSVDLPISAWIMPIDIRLLQMSEIFELPRRIQVANKEFHLRGVTVYATGHFSAYILKGESWYRYCGMSSPRGTLVTAPNTGSTPERAIYTI